MHPQDVRIGSLLIKVGILKPVTSISQAQPRRVRTEFLNRLAQRQEIALALRHLLSVQHQVSICTHAEGPLVFGQDGDVVVQGHRQMVRYKVLCG